MSNECTILDYVRKDHILYVLGVDDPSLHSPRWYIHYSYYRESDDLEFAQIANLISSYVDYYDSFEGWVPVKHMLSYMKKVNNPDIVIPLHAIIYNLLNNIIQ